MDHRMRGGPSGERLDVAVNRLAARQHGVFTRNQAAQVGASRGLVDRRVTARRWEPLYPGVYRLAGSPESWRQHLLAACFASGAHVAASHRAAGVLRNLPGGEERLEVSVPDGRRVRLRGILVHRAASLERVDRALIDRIPVTSGTRTVIDLAAVLPADILERALDEALRSHQTTIARLRWRIQELGTRGRPGMRILRNLLEDRRRDGAKSDSDLETRFLRLLRGARLPLPMPQHPVRVGRRLIHLDFAYPELRLGIETDGYRWHSGKQRWESDLTRGNGLMALGWRLFRFTDDDIDRRPDEVCKMIADAIDQGVGSVPPEP